jgi:hypothetical protein
MLNPPVLFSGAADRDRTKAAAGRAMRPAARGELLVLSACVHFP